MEEIKICKNGRALTPEEVKKEIRRINGEAVRPSTADRIALKCAELCEMLLEKNRKYGNSALDPCRVFSTASTVEQLKVRIDDKLSRIRNRAGDEDEDALMDLAGYLILLMIKLDELAKDGGK